jgi:hypothetical protein
MNVRQAARVVRSAKDERRRGIYWLIAGVVVLGLMFGMWWLVEETNREGTHDAQLLPLFALIPLLIGASHLLRAWLRRRSREGDPASQPRSAAR